MLRTLGRLLAPWMAACAVLVAGCGGGGGGGDGGGGAASGFRISLDRSAVQITQEENQPVSPAGVVATWTGEPSGDAFIGAVVEGEGVDPEISIALSATRADVGIAARAGLAAGTYTGRVVVLVCADVNCDRPIGGTPLYIGYTVTVTPGLRVTPNPLELSAVSGNGAAATLNVQLPPGIATFEVQPSSAAPWLQLGTPNGNSLPLSARSWRAGQYDTTLEVRTSGNRLVSVPVRYQVAPPPGGEHDLGLAPAALTYATTENAVAAPQTLNLTLPTWDARDPVVATQYGAGASDWLSVARTAEGYAVTASAAQLSQGTYSATLTFTPEAPGTAMQVPVSLTVGPGLVAPAAPVITVHGETLAAALAGSVQVRAAGDAPAVGWTAAASHTWLRLTQATGVTGGTLAYEVDRDALPALANFAEHSAVVTITPAAAHITPVSFTVVLRKQLPEVTSVGPSLLVTGTTTRVVVRGRGFTSAADVAARLQSSGLPVSAVTRVTDGELVMQANPADTSDRRISIGNGLGLDTGGATVRMVAPRDFAYAAIPNTGLTRTVVFDARRAAIYAVNAGRESLSRYRFQSGNWVADGAPVPAIVDAGMAPDGQSIVVASTTGRLRLVDPESLADLYTVDHTSGFPAMFRYSQGIPSTNDGRSWLVAGTGSWNDLVYFDHATRTLRPQPQQPGLLTSYYGGPLLFAARDGERMVVMQSGGLSPAPPTLYLDSVDGLLRVNPAGLTYFYDASLSDDGSRMLIGRSDLRDRQFNLLGRTVVPDGSGHFAVGAVMSPDGRLAYLLTYPEAAMNGWPTALVPRVYVFDATATGGGNLPVLGQFDLAHFPTCRDDSYECSWQARVAISPDGRTLVFGGDAHVVVAPIPSGLRSAATGAGLRPRSAATMQRWATGTR